MKDMLVVINILFSTSGLFLRKQEQLYGTIVHYINEFLCSNINKDLTETHTDPWRWLMLREEALRSFER